MFAEAGARTTHDFGNASCSAGKAKVLLHSCLSPPEGGEAKKDAYLAFTGYSLLARQKS